MAGISRRNFLRGIGAGMAAGLIPEAGAAAADPHHFLLITFAQPSGLDASYLFDARPLSMTERKIIQNYRKGGEPERWTGANGQSCLATEIVKPLRPYRNHFSIVNGVTMAMGFDG